MANKHRLFTIQMASEASGVSAHTIRAWEKRYTALSPQRSESGKRIYTAAEVERLKTLALLVNLGTSISQIAHLPDDELILMLSKLSHTRERYSRDEFLSPESTLDDPQSLLVDLRAFQVDALSRKLSLLATRLPGRELVFSYLVPLIKEAKEVYPQGGPQLQSLLLLIRFHASWVSGTKEAKPQAGRRKLFIASLRETDTFDPLLASILCNHHRHPFFYSHVFLPMDCMVETAESLSADRIIVCLGSGENSESLMAEILARVPVETELWIGASTRPNALPGRKLIHFQALSELDERLSALP